MAAPAPAKLPQYKTPFGELRGLFQARRQNQSCTRTTEPTRSHEIFRARSRNFRRLAVPTKITVVHRSLAEIEGVLPVKVKAGEPGICRVCDELHSKCKYPLSHSIPLIENIPGPRILQPPPPSTAPYFEAWIDRLSPCRQEIPAKARISLRYRSWYRLWWADWCAAVWAGTFRFRPDPPLNSFQHSWPEIALPPNTASLARHLIACTDSVIIERRRKCKGKWIMIIETYRGCSCRKLGLDHHECLLWRFMTTRQPDCKVLGQPVPHCMRCDPEGLSFHDRAPFELGGDVYASTQEAINAQPSILECIPRRWRFSMRRTYRAQIHLSAPPESRAIKDASSLQTGSQSFSDRIARAEREARQHVSVQDDLPQNLGVDLLNSEFEQIDSPDGAEAIELKEGEIVYEAELGDEDHNEDCWHVSKDEVDQLIKHLSAREYRILEIVTEGGKGKEVAAALGVTSRHGRRLITCMQSKMRLALRKIRR